MLEALGGWISLLAGLSKRAALRADRSIDYASLAVAMARGIKATLLCAHDPTVPVAYPRGAPGARAPPSGLAQQPDQWLSGNYLC